VGVVGDSAANAIVTVTGTASDAQSGMSTNPARVSVAADAPSAVLASRILATGTGPNGAQDMTDWSASVPVAGYDHHRIFVWASDAAGVETGPPAWRDIQVVRAHVAKTLDERLDQRRYLSELIAFATSQLSVPSTWKDPINPAKYVLAPATVEQLVEVLDQKVDLLSTPLSASTQATLADVNELRGPIERLRVYIKTKTLPEGASSTAGQGRYLAQAYACLLAAAGTTYAELRLSRSATPTERDALASRLGILLSTSHPDQLQQLTLDGDALNEAALETWFGLPATTPDKDPLRSVRGQLTNWQLDCQNLDWAAQDQAPSTDRRYRAVLDPDVVSATDVVSQPSADPLSLLATRTQQLDDYLRQLTQLRQGKTDSDGLKAVLAFVLGALDLTALESKAESGQDISSDLRAAGLTWTGYRHLLQMIALAADTLTIMEWDDTFAVLVGAYKQTLYPAWCVAEAAVVLSPDNFLLNDTGPAVNSYRVDPQARLAWQADLRTRTRQRQSLIDSGATAVAETERVTLAILRDALLTDVPVADGSDAGELMTQRLLTDVKVRGTLRTTRLDQATESLQSLLVGIRGSELTTDHPAYTWSLTGNSTSFDTGWAWMGSWDTWRAATLAFLFPEENLDPTLLGSTLSSNFGILYNTLNQPGKLTPETVDSAASSYAAAALSGLSWVYLNGGHDPANQTKGDQTSKSLAADLGREAFWAVPIFIAQRLHAGGQYLAALDWLWTLYPYNDSTVVSISHLINLERQTAQAVPDLTPPDWTTTSLNPFAIINTAAMPRPAPFTRYTLLTLVRVHLDYADAEFAAGTTESVAHARALYLTAQRLVANPLLQPVMPISTLTPELLLPELAAFGMRAGFQLEKIREGLSIAGLPRAPEITADSGTVTRPTSYRYKVLLERARQTAAQAAQIETEFMAALEKYDAKSFEALNAQQALSVSGAQITVQAARVQEAGLAVTAASAQQTKAEAMISTYSQAIAAPPNRYEADLLSQYGQMRDLQDLIGQNDAAIAIAQAVANGSNMLNAAETFGASVAAAAQEVGGAILKMTEQNQTNRLQAQMQANQLLSGIESRRQEWAIQQTSARQDAVVAAAQVSVASAQVNVAVQEQAAAVLQQDQARARLLFLTTQFTNADLYLWLSQQLGGVYRYFLQQATATALLAQTQLGFEHAEQPQSYIRDDYTKTADELRAANSQTDRRGLTGAEQLTEDISRLDEYAFSSGRRKLNLSQTFSLAQMMPVEFLQFRNTGTIVFSPTLALFDQDFPGHYLRLVQQIHTSVVALVPPSRGIRATLYSTGISRATTRQDVTFTQVTLRQEPDIVALTSPANATGVFELDAQSAMLLPFEGSGVETTFELQLPPAANPFDYTTLADVLITIDYTALFDGGYQSQVIADLNKNRTRSADCVYSLSRDFPDQWYALNNPTPGTARSVTLTLGNVDLPMSIDQLSVADIAVCWATRCLRRTATSRVRTR
jgi:Tc toxin complex TcA C-terminal TcB-binding domain